MHITFRRSSLDVSVRLRLLAISWRDLSSAKDSEEGEASVDVDSQRWIKLEIIFC